ncbi:MAG TPA: hypothetical protein VD884_18305 [Ohtaekwangia sp.]|nr:hypothetical protein [Ohtaekwangia sp.]
MLLLKSITSYYEKIQHFSFCVAIAATLGFSSCKDDDEKSKAPDNKFTLESLSEKITDAALIYDESEAEDDEGNPYHRNSIAFITEGGQLVSDPQYGGVNFDGDGSYFELFLNNEGQTLEAGNYPFQTEENEQPFDFWLGVVVTERNTDNEKGYRFTDGAVVITKSGSTYDIKVEGEVRETFWDEEDDEWGLVNMDATPIDISLQYKGKLDVYSWDF